MAVLRPRASNRPGAVWIGAVIAAGAVLVVSDLWVSLAAIVLASLAVLISKSRLRSAKPFLWALSGAALFVVMRMVYKALFGGLIAAPTDEAVLWVLPQVQLAEPFTGIHLFGVVTAQSLVIAATLALPFAAVIVLFGGANALADPRALLERAPKRLANVTWAMSIGLSVFPTVIRTAARLRVARALRGERGALTLAVTLLEHAIERSERLGLSMASRGFGRTRWGVEQGTGAAALALQNVSARIGEQVVLRGVTLEVHPSTVTLITGATGSGKTSLLQVMRGVFTEVTGGQVDGCATLAGRAISVDSPIALTLQRPEESFVAATVRAELAFGAAQVGLESVATVERLAADLGIAALLDRPVDQLSAGEAALVSIAAALVTSPQVLLLDEPIADLDAAATERVRAALQRLRVETNTAIVIAEHRPEALLDLVDVRYRIAGGALVRDNAALIQGESVVGHARPISQPHQPAVELCRELTVQQSGVTVLHEVTLAVHPSAVTALVGANGAGKTTLLEHLALDRGKAREGVVMVSHNVDDMLFRQTIADECRANDRTAKLPTGSTEASIRRFLPGLKTLEQHPRDCSAGTRVVLALALQLARSSCVLLLDEPTRGLDARARTELAVALRRATAAGNAVLVATHDEAFAHAVANHTVYLREGRLAAPDGALAIGGIASAGLTSSSGVGV